MPLAALIVIVLALVVGPSIWTRWILQRHQRERQDLPGTGGELANHLITRYELTVTLEETEQGDHYDPTTKTIRLTAPVMKGRSLTAVATAAHEVGHAIQHAIDYRPLLMRKKLAEFAAVFQQATPILFVGAPLLMAIHPLLGRGALLLALASLAVAVIVHLVTLPVEWHASFTMALPILKQGRYISPKDQSVVKHILTACAFTYVAGALSSIFNVLRWWRYLRP